MAFLVFYVDILATAAKSLQLCPTLCSRMDCSPPGSSAHGIFQARIWSVLPFPTPGDLSNTETELMSPTAAAKLLQLCLTLCDPIEGSPPGSPIPGILQARTLEWFAFPSLMDRSEK